MQCLDNIIGLSETVCPCLIDGSEPVDYNLSNSGLYLDRLDGFNINMAGGADDCAKGGIWDRMTIAVEDAKKAFIKDMLGVINQDYAPRNTFYSGVLGSTNFKNTLANTHTYGGIKITPVQLVGGYITLKRIGVLINQASLVTVKVYSNENDSTLINTYTTVAPVVANTLSWITLATPLELPMWNNERYIYYWVVIEFNGGFQPKDNKKDCGCGGVRRDYLKWFDFVGSKGNDVTNMTSFQNTNDMNGLVLDIDAKCKASHLICSEDKPLDFENDAFSQYMAEAIRFKAGEKLYRDLLASTEINRITLMNREDISKQVMEWGKNYMDVITFLQTLIDVNQNDCMVCRRSTKMILGGILS